MQHKLANALAGGALSLLCTAVPSIAQADDSILKGGMRFYPLAPSVAAQNPNCADPIRRGLGVIMSFVGVGPWITNHPLLERNCATLLDILPVMELPFREEMIRRDSLWTRVVRVRFPSNAFRLREGYGFGWCATASCETSLLVTFNDQAIVGFCLQRSRRTTYFLSDGSERGFLGKRQGRESCVEPKTAIQSIFSLAEWGTRIDVPKTDFSGAADTSSPRYMRRYHVAPRQSHSAPPPPPINSFYGSCHGGAFYGC